jgi:hypothetical protein
MAEKRFVKTYSDGAFGSNEIWVDTKTGVNYLFHASGYAGGLTPLLNRDGPPVVTPISKTCEEA